MKAPTALPAAHGNPNNDMKVVAARELSSVLESGKYQFAIDPRGAGSADVPLRHVCGIASGEKSADDRYLALALMTVVDVDVEILRPRGSWNLPEEALPHVNR